MKLSRNRDKAWLSFMSDKIETWLKEQKSKVSSMKYWTSIAIERKDLPPEHWSDGPYPHMEKLLALVRHYKLELEAMRVEAAQPRVQNWVCMQPMLFIQLEKIENLARAAEKKALSIVEGK